MLTESAFSLTRELESTIPNASTKRSVSLVLMLLLFGALGAAGCGDDVIVPPSATDGGADAGDVDAGMMLPDTGIGSRAVTITRLAPNHGSFTGGTTVVIRGTGFNAEALVTIGGHAVQPADIELIDPNRLSIVTPAGEVGPADVVVSIDGTDATIVGGYTYDAFYIDPNRGAVSGGTLVNVIGMGTGFADGDDVVFGRTPCNDVTVVSESTITCRTPAMAAGSVDVTVVHAADASETVVEDGFTYYDSTDPFGGGLGGGPIAGTLNVTVLNGGNGEPVEDAFVIVGEDVSTEYQGLSDLNGQITFSGSDLIGPLMVTAAKFCFEKTSIVSFDATDVTIFLVPWMDPMCGMGGMPPTGPGRNGAFISGELIWPSDFGLGPQPWFNVPNPRADEVKVAYVYTTQASIDYPNPEPSLGGAVQRVLETGATGDSGYLYRIFARPAGLAVYALAGLENTSTGEFIPYVTGIARNVLAGPGEEVENTDIIMDIPLDHTLDVSINGLPGPARTGPDRFMVTGYMDLGGEGVIVRTVNGDTLDIVRGRNNDRPFRFWAQPALFGALSDGRYRIIGGWYTGDFDSQPYTVVVRNGVRAFDELVTLDGFLGIPQATAPAYGERIPADRVLRWSTDGPPADLHIVLMIGGDGNPAWRHFVPGDVFEAPVPDLGTIEGIDDISAGFLTWVVYAVKIPGFDFDEFSYTYLQERYWSHYALDYFSATR